MSFPIFEKDPTDVLEYQWDWSKWLKTDMIATSTWIVPDGITMTSNSHTTTDVTIWLSGGTVGTKYPVTNRITTASGRTKDQTLVFRIKEH